MEGTRVMIEEQEVLRRVRRLTRERLEVCISEAWVKPARGSGGRLFEEVDVARVQLIVELSEDLAVNDDSVPIILSLIDQVHALKRHLGALEEAVTAQDEPVRQDIVKRCVNRLDTPRSDD